MSTVLFVSIAFPPKYDSEGLVIAKYLPYLRDACSGRVGLRCVTSKMPTLNMPYDRALENSVQGLDDTIALPIFESRYTNYLLRHLWPTLAQSPDSKFTFHWQWRRVVNKLQQPPSLIYSRSFPASSAVMALKLKRHYGVPWIMHLSDPWADSPHIDYRGGAREYNQRLERQCFEAADVISLTSKRTIEFFQNKYRDLNKRFAFFPNVYDPKDLPVPTFSPPTGGRRIRLVHTGGLAGSRSPEPFLKGVAALPHDIQSRLDIVFAGHVDRANRAVFNSYNLPCVTYIGALDSYREALALQQTADVLILIDFPVDRPDLRVYFLSKLLDYQMTGKPIVGVTDKGSECELFINSQAGHCFERHNSEGVSGYLRWLIDAPVEHFRPRPVCTEFDARHNAERLADLFVELTKGAH